MNADYGLALALARRLDAVTPASVRLAAWSEENIVIIGCSDGPPLVWVQMNDFDSAEVFAQRLLDNVQEFVIENAAHGGWPPIDAARPHDRQSASSLPKPSVAVENETLRLWFGDRDRPSLTLPPISGRELAGLRVENEPADGELAQSLWSESLQRFRAAKPMVEQFRRSRGLPPSAA